MGSKRIIDGRIRKSQTFTKLTYRQRDLWQGLIAVADDQGRMPGSAMAVRSAVWPEDDLLTSDVEKELKVLEDAGNILRYTVNGSLYLQIVNWWKYQGGSQWMSASDYPPPPGWTDRARYHGKGNVLITQNWDGEGGFTGATPPASPKLDSWLDSNQDSRLDSGGATPLSCREVKDEDEVKDDDDKCAAAPASPSSPQPDTKFSALSALLATKLRLNEYTGGAQRWLEAVKEILQVDPTEADIDAALAYMTQNRRKIAGPWSLINPIAIAKGERERREDRRAPPGPNGHGDGNEFILPDGTVVHL